MRLCVRPTPASIALERLYFWGSWLIRRSTVFAQLTAVKSHNKAQKHETVDAQRYGFSGSYCYILGLSRAGGGAAVQSGRGLGATVTGPKDAVLPCKEGGLRGSEGV
jgi:hypothetical protein